jgi:hypothetical protein
MKKASVIFESVQLGTFDMSDQEFNQYKNLVQKFLSEIYPDKVNIGDEKFISGQKFDYPGRYKSIINYANTNITLLMSIVKMFSIQNVKELFEFLNKNYKEIFSPEGSSFTNTLNILKKTEEYGNQNEQLAAIYMQSVIKQKTGQNVEVKRTETDSREDLIDGIDIYFTLDGKRYTCQVKPLKEIELFNNFESYKIKSSGRIKKYNINYFIFVNKNRQKFAVFKNRNVTISGDTLTFPMSSFVFSN